MRPLEASMLTEAVAMHVVASHAVIYEMKFSFPHFAAEKYPSAVFFQATDIDKRAFVERKK